MPADRPPWLLCLSLLLLAVVAWCAVLTREAGAETIRFRLAKSTNAEIVTSIDLEIAGMVIVRRIPWDVVADRYAEANVEGLILPARLRIRNCYGVNGDQCSAWSNELLYDGTPTCEGDFDGDGAISLVDLSLFFDLMADPLACTGLGVTLPPISP